MSKQETGTNPETWVDAYGDYLYRFAIARVGDAHTAADIVQETFLAALKARKNFSGRSSEKTWIIAILKHKIIDHYRKKSRSQPVENMDNFTEALDAQFDDKNQWKIKPGGWDSNPLKVYEQKEFIDTLYKCLADLPERLARVFILREIEGLSTEDICKAMKITATNVWVMLHRARSGLRRCLELNWLDDTSPEG